MKRWNTTFDFMRIKAKKRRISGEKRDVPELILGLPWTETSRKNCSFWSKDKTPDLDPASFASRDEC